MIDKKTHKIKYDRHGHVEMGNCLKDVEYYERLGLPAADAKTLARVMKQSMLYDGDPLYGRHQWPVSWIYGLGLTTVIGYLLPTYVLERPPYFMTKSYTDLVIVLAM